MYSVQKKKTRKYGSSYGGDSFRRLNGSVPETSPTRLDSVEYQTRDNIVYQVGT